MFVEKLMVNEAFASNGNLQISGPPEFLNNRTEADEEASARDAEHAKRISRKKKKIKPKGIRDLFASL